MPDPTSAPTRRGRPSRPAPTSALSRALIARIAAAGRTQSELAAAAGVAQCSVSYALADREPRLETLVRLARTLGLSPSDLGQMLFESYPPDVS